MSRLLIDEQPLQVIPSLACKIGLNRAMFLQQLHYWLQKSGHERDGRLWIFNTYEEWHQQFPFWTAEAIRKIVNQLEDKGIIETTDRYNERRGDRTKWYTINYEDLDRLLDRPDKSTEQPENLPPQGPDKSTERYQRVPENNNRESLTGHSPEEKPAKVMTSKTVDRTTEVGFDAASHQKANWGKGWAGYIYVPEGREPPSAERQYAVLQEIVGAASGKGGKARYFLSVEDAVKRVEGKSQSQGNAYGVTPAQRDEQVRRMKQGYEWLFDDEPVAPFDKEEALRRMRGEPEQKSGAA